MNRRAILTHWLHPVRYRPACGVVELGGALGVPPATSTAHPDDITCGTCRHIRTQWLTKHGDAKA
jgi:hypothetical protein